MKRRRALRNAAVIASTLIGGCLGSIGRGDSDWSIEANWPTYRSDTRNTNYVPESTGPQAETVLWEETTVTKPNIQPVIVDNTVIVGASVSDSPGAVRAFDATNGEVEWEGQVQSSIGTTPAVLGEVVLVGVDNRGIVGFDRTSGERVWSISVESEFGETGFAISDNRGFVTTRDGLVIALEASGVELWRTDLSLDTGLESHLPQIIAEDGLLYVGTRDGMHILDADTGDRNWLYARGRRVPKGPILHGDTLYLAHASDRGEDYPQAQIDAVDIPSRDLQWSIPLEQEFPPAPSTDGDQVYISQLHPKRVVAVDTENGVENWTTQITAPINDAPTVAAERLYVPTLDGIEVLDRSTGEHVQKIAPEWLSLYTSPCIVDDVAIVTTSRGTTYAIGKPD